MSWVGVRGGSTGPTWHVFLCVYCHQHSLHIMGLPFVSEMGSIPVIT